MLLMLAQANETTTELRLLRLARAYFQEEFLEKANNRRLPPCVYQIKKNVLSTPYKLSCCDKNCAS